VLACEERVARAVAAARDSEARAAAAAAVATSYEDLSHTQVGHTLCAVCLCCVCVCVCVCKGAHSPDVLTP
jgi:hypothetical protein